MRRSPLKYVAPLLGAVVLLAGALLITRAAVKAPRPNIILISLDTLRADYLGCYGSPLGTSPHIDAFRRESVQFMQALSQARTTATSHMSLFTGLFPPVHRVSSWLRSRDNAKRFDLAQLDDRIPTLAQYLRESGYHTVGLHNGGLVSPDFGFQRGFDVYSEQLVPWLRLHKKPLGLRFVQKLLQRAVRNKKPLFLFLHTYTCHAPYIKAPQEMRERFLPHPLADLPVESIPDGSSFWSKYKSFWAAIDGNNEAHRRQVRSLYAAEVNYADWIVGRILALLKENGFYEKALIVLVSDHGEEFWEHGQTSHRQLHIETLHVPLLIKFPGGKDGGKRILDRVGMFDLMPTILDHLRIEPRVPLQARSLLPLIRGRESGHRPVLSFEDGLQFVRFQRGPYVYINGIRTTPGDWLFDAVHDPGETRNLAIARPEVVREMRSVAAGIMEEQRRIRARIVQGAPALRGLAPGLQKQLEALGYL